MKGRTILLILSGILMVLLTAIGVMNLLGYRLIEGVMVYMLFGLLIGLGLIALALWLTGKARKGAVRLIVGTVCTVVTFGALMLMLSFFSFLSIFYTPHAYTTLQSPAGKSVVVMRSYSQEYAGARAEARGGETLLQDDLGYEYQIYPVFSKFFYNSNAGAEGRLEIGCSSGATLMHAWEGESLHMYIENAEEFDTGELNFH